MIWRTLNERGKALSSPAAARLKSMPLSKTFRTAGLSSRSRPVYKTMSAKHIFFYRMRRWVLQEGRKSYIGFLWDFSWFPDGCVFHIINLNCAIRAQLRLTLAERVVWNWPGIGNGDYMRRWGLQEVAEILCGISFGFLWFPGGCVFHIISMNCAIRAQLRLTLAERVVRNWWPGIGKGN